MKKLFNRITEKQARVLTLCLLGAAVVLLGAALWLNLRAGGSGTTLTTYAMGSYIQQTVYGAGAEEAAQQASSAVTELENLISWRVEDSDIATLNQEAGGEFQDIDPQTWDILNTALQVCQASGGAFDITIAPISWLWDFDEEPHLPSRACCPRWITPSSPCKRTAPPPCSPAPPPWIWAPWARAPPATPPWPPTKRPAWSGPWSPWGAA